MLTRLLLILSLLAVSIVNILADVLPFHGGSTNEIVNRLPILIMPAYYTFFIRLAIISAFIYWVYRSFQSEINTVFQTRALLLIGIWILNLGHLMLWHNDFYMYSTLSLLLSLLIHYLLYLTYDKHINQWDGRVPVSLSFGWTFLMMMFDFNYAITWHNWSAFGLSDPLWAVIMLTLATAFALHFVYHYTDIPLGLVFIWTFVGIAMKNGFEELFVSVAALFLSAVIFGFIVWVKQFKYKLESIAR